MGHGHLLYAYIVSAHLFIMPAAATAATIAAKQYLQQGGIRLLQQTDTDPTAVCSPRYVSYMLIDGLALPLGNFTLAASLALTRNLKSSQQSDSTLLTAAGLTVSVNRLQGTLTLSISNGPSATYYLQMFNTTLSLAVADKQRVRLCMDFTCPSAALVTGFTRNTSGWLSLPQSSTQTLQLANITLGSSGSSPVLDTWLDGLWVAPAVVDIATAAAAAATLARYLSSSSAQLLVPPTITMDQVSGSLLTSLVVAEPVAVSVSASSAASTIGLKLRLTFYGVAPRYIIRAQASDMMGGWASKDFEVLVCKAGDIQGRAPCCRTTANIIAQQLGRPIDPTTFRPSWINSSATAVGWDWNYLMGSEDLEAERLFDYGLLAPVETGPVTMTTCPDSYLAGPGSPTVYGVSATPSVNVHSNQGHAKRVAILPQGFNWAANPGVASSQLPSCVTHWTSWVADSPYGRTISGSQSSSCSFACTPEGVQQLVTQTGTFDRWAESVIENTYGRVSFLSDPVILPTLYMPEKASADDSAFSYSETPIYDYMQGLGHDMQQDFHTVAVLSPRPNFINNGITAWAKAGGSPLIFVMRCNPQHYYLVHEVGHRLGMPHATIYKLDAGPDAVPPTSPLGQGVMQDTYSDRLDMMACCKGDYSLHNRILSGWVPASERALLGLADVAALGAATSGSSTNATNSSKVVWQYTLWPYDRPESKGQVKGVSIRLEDGKVLVLGYRSTPYWQDVRISATSSKPTSSDRLTQPEHMRNNVAGLSVEYSKRYLDAYGSSQWSVRGLLDFNMAFMRFPDGLPASAGTYPPQPPGAAFTLLREGDAWLDEDHNLLIAVQRIAACPNKPPTPVYQYGVYNFYGFRGEDPGAETVKRADYTGYAAGINCMQLRVVTGVTTAPGTLDVRVRMQGMDEQNRLVLGGSQCGFPVRPRLKLMMPDGTEVLAIVWRDNLNRTVASDVTAVVLPPLAPLAEASVQDTDHCNIGCDWRYHVKVLAADGAQTQMDIAIGSISLSVLTMTVTYSYYLKRSILTASEEHSIPVVQQTPAQAIAPQGRQLLDQTALWETLAQKVYDSSSLPDVSCSHQWTVSINLNVPAAQLEAPAAGAAARQLQLLQVLSGTDGTSGWPTVGLKMSSAGASILVQWGSDTRASREQTVTPKADSINHLVVARDGNRLGVWVNSEGSWLIDSVWCMPDSKSVNYCSKVPTAEEEEFSFTALRVADASTSSSITFESIHVYNYALPRLSQAKESGCTEMGSCGRFLVAGWPVPAESTVPAGTIDMHGVVPSVPSTRISLQSNSYYLLVGPWSRCSAKCSGGWQTRDVRCMQLSANPASPVSQVPLDDCPLNEEIPSTSKRCNTVRCPQHTLQLLVSKHSSCGRDCHLLGNALDSAQLVCINSVGQLQPLSQCCTLCNATDWTAIPWNNNISAILPTFSLALGSDVKVLQPSVIAPGSSLAVVLSSGKLPTICQSEQACDSNVRWQLGSWSSCSKSCGGGSKTRTASCVLVQTGAVVGDATCQQALGAVAADMLTAPCGTKSCKLYTWKLSNWSTCSGDADYGHSSRSVACVDSTGAHAAAGASACPSAAPSSTAICLRTMQSAVCRPSFIAEADYGSKDCSGHGTCTMTGCSCSFGWHGQFCEVSPDCAGVMNKARKCCPSGLLDSQGACCPAGSVVDRQGQCCQTGAVDACGVCEGNSWSVDVMAVCCAGIVDAIGDCCASGTLDECGVCDGDGTSCRLTLRLLVQVPAGTNITDNFTPATEGTSSAAPWQLAVQQLLQPTLSKLSTSVQLQLQSIGAESASASLVAAAGQATETKISRDLLAVEDATAAASAVCPDDGSQSFAGRMATPDAAAYGTSACSNNCQQSAAAIVTAAAEVAAGATVATARQLLDTTNWLAAYVNVVLMPAVAPASPGASASSARNALSISVSSVGSSLVVDLEAQSISATSRLAGTSGSSSIPSGSSSPALQLLRVLMAERVGVCGNSVCEVGERPLLTPNGDLLHVATSPCPQDCPLSVMVCPAPVAAVGDPSLECGGHGRCIRSQAVCDCFAGYTGDACEQCLAGFYPHDSQCVPQYINGRTIFDAVVDEVEQKKQLTGTVFLVMGAIAAACAFASMAWVLYKWLVLGQRPQLLLALQRLLPGRKAGAGISQKHLFEEQVEMSATPRRTFKLGIEEAAAWSQGARRRRTSSAVAGGDSTDDWDSDLLKAIRANVADTPTSQLPVSTTPRLPGNFRLSLSGPGSLSGIVSRIASSAGASRRGYSSIGGVDDLNLDESVEAQQSGPASLAAEVAPRSSMSLAGLYSNLQRGISQAGTGVVRVLSEGVSRLSSTGSVYNRMISDDEGLLMMDQPEGAAISHIGVLRDGKRAAAALEHSEDAAWPLTAAEEAVAAAAAEAWPPRPAGLPRIKTRRTSRQSVSGGGVAAAQYSYAIDGAALSGSDGAAVLRQPPPTAAGPAAPAVTGPSWRTRADYQASLEFAGAPVLEPRLVRQAKEWRTGSMQDELSARSSRARAGGGGFVETPHSGNDATNRDAVEAFGARMERWFSPGSQTGSAGSSANSSTDGTGGLLGLSRHGPTPLAGLAQQRQRVQQARQGTNHNSRLRVGISSDSGQQAGYMPPAGHTGQASGDGTPNASESNALPSWRSRLREASLAGAAGGAADGQPGLIPRPRVAQPGRSDAEATSPRPPPAASPRAPASHHAGAMDHAEDR